MITLYFAAPAAKPRLLPPPPWRFDFMCRRVDGTEILDINKLEQT